MLQCNILNGFSRNFININKKQGSNIMKHKTSQSGFTLIELIAVMVILGILAKKTFNIGSIVLIDFLV